MMKKRHILHWAMGVILTPLLGSCTTDDAIGGAGREECDIMSGQPMTVTSATRSTDGRTSSTQFDSGETVWLWANKTDGTEYIKAWQLTAQSEGSFTGTNKYWPSDGSSLNVYALHGNFKNSPSISEGTTQWSKLSLTHTVETDQTSPKNKRLSDLLYSHPSTAFAPNPGSVQLTFDHLLAKITVKLDLKNSTGITTNDFENATVSIMGIKPEAIFDSSAKTASTSGGTAKNIQAGTISKPTELTSEAYDAGCAIVPLQTINAGTQLIKISLKDRTFIYKASTATEFQQGQEYTYTLTILGKKITGTLSVSPFLSDNKEIPFKDYFDYLADLKNRNVLGSSNDPYDLSLDYNGLMNTANCYVVTHPGYYKFPLVYGNAIKNGATNAIAYGVGTGSTTFVNHLGNKITDPYIYNNKDDNEINLVANSVELLWQDAENLISNIRLSGDKQYIQFEITKDNIEQGNAVIAVKDGSGKIMWSWHIWVTNKNVYETQAVTASYNSTNKTFMFMPFPLGWNDSTTAPTCTYYQWGRKDPFPPSDGSTLTSNTDKTLYAYNNTSGTSIIVNRSTSNSQADIATSILYPSTFYGGSQNWCSQESYELWNVGNSAISVNFNPVTKSVYDPSPAGFRLPETAAFTGFTTGTWNNTTKGYTFTTNGVNTYWQACGFRDYQNSGSLKSVGTNGYYWSAGPSNTGLGYLLDFSSSYVHPQAGNARAYAFSVRPVSE